MLAARSARANHPIERWDRPLPKGSGGNFFMKEFYIYKLKKEFIDAFGKFDPKLAHPDFNKNSNRPMLCVKDRGGQNWLIPMTSLDPDKNNYVYKAQETQRYIVEEKDEDVKALMRFDDLTGSHSNPNFENALLFYQAIPVKGSYVKPYTTKKGKRVLARLSYDEQQTVKTNFLKYMKRYVNGKASGFLFVRLKENANKDSERQFKVNTFQFNAKAIKYALYYEHCRLLREQKERKARAEERAQIKGHKKELRDQYKEAVGQGLAELGVPEGTASPDSLFLTKLVEKNCSQPDKTKAPPAVAEIRSATKTPGIPRKDAQERRK
jgi:hypothetical protein